MWARSRCLCRYVVGRPAARTRVLISSSDGTSEWGTVGVNDNIVEASLQALVDSLEYALVKDRVREAVAAR